MSKMNGKVKFFSEKGFGFIVESETNNEYFVIREESPSLTDTKSAFELTLS